MQRIPPIVVFAAGFVAAAALGIVFVLPMSHQAAQVNTDSDVHRPLHAALEHIEQSASHGQCEKAAAQLNLLNKRFAEYRAGGPAPTHWYEEVIAATQPAR